jgi:hypothetical protein
MAIYWHPLLAQFLRQALGDCIRIDDSIPLGEMPLEMGLRFHPTVPIESLPYPFNHLGPQTLGELKGADDSADWAALAQIESYACLYQRKQKIAHREEITLWVIASQFSDSFFAYIHDLTPMGDGVQRGTLAGFPIYAIDLETLPLTGATFPLLLVYKGNIEREKEIAQFFIAHYQELGELSFFLELLHPQALKEVLREMNLDSLRGYDFDLPAILDLFETQKIIQNIGLDKVIQTIGPKEVIQTIGLKEVIQTALSSLTDEEKDTLIEQIRQSQRNGEKEKVAS